LKIELLIFTVVFLMTAQMQAFAQCVKKVQFSGYEVEEFKCFKQIKFQYKPIYGDATQDTTKGILVLDENAKTLTIDWLNGSDWIISYSNCTINERKRRKDKGCGKVRTISLYTGKIDDNCEAILIIDNQDISGCQFQLYKCSRYYSIYERKAFQHRYIFEASGVCLE
jgi:hypothetical protein